MNTIYFRRASKVMAREIVEQPQVAQMRRVGALDANLRKLGYALNDEVFEALSKSSLSYVEDLGKALIREAKEIKGVRRYSPMYPNFPKQVMEASEAELYFNAVMHYFGTAVGLRIMPDYDKIERPKLDFDESKFTLVTLGSENDFYALVRNIMQGKSAMSETDKADLASLDGVTLAYAEAKEFPNRENKAFIANLFLTKGLNIDTFNFDTATDVLRLAAAMSDGDVSLAEPTRFRSFKRAERRMLMRMLSEIKGGIVEDMDRYPAMWKRLGERLHPGEFKNYPEVVNAFKIIRENGAVNGFNSRVEAAIAAGQVQPVVDLLVDRPGEFARRLDKVLRMSGSSLISAWVLNEFARVAHKASPTVLLQARNNFVNRAGKDIRVFFPKGSVAKMQSVADRRGGIRKTTVDDAVRIFDAALVKAFEGRENLGGSWVDPALKSIAVPFGQRNASKSVQTLGRGSRISLGDDANIVRFFIWWHDAEGDGGWGYGRHTDIDLSAVMFNDGFDYVDSITYYNLRGSGAVHSGDITSAPNGASEFIDIDLDRLRARGVRYVAMTLHSYSGQNLVELPECFAGFMERRDLNSGEVYDPRTVVNKADLTSNTRGATPFIFDLETREAIWVDLSMQISGGYSNVRSTQGQITGIVEAMTTLTPPNLYDLFTAHATARGGVVSKEKAKTIFSFDGDVTPFNTELILDEYL